MNTEDLYRLLRTGHVQAQGIVDTVAEPLLVLDATLSVQAASRSFFDTFKVDRYETIGKPFRELGNRQWDIPELHHLLMDVIPKSAALVDYRVEHDFPGLGARTMLLTARTLFHPDNALHGLLLTIVDVTERSRQDATRALQFAEVVHRLKNLLSVVRSIAVQTATERRTGEQYRDDFLGRLGALVEAQDLAYAETGPTGLASLVERILLPYSARPQAVAVEPGPPLELAPAAILSLGLVLHELATNAAKHGALSRRGGRVVVGWRVDTAAGSVRIGWAESGGPPVAPPVATGYGTRLIASATTYSLGGTVKQQFEAAGVQVEIVLPLGPAVALTAAAPPATPSRRPRAKRRLPDRS